MLVIQCVITNIFSIPLLILTQVIMKEIKIFTRNTMEVLIPLVADAINAESIDPSLDLDKTYTELSAYVSNYPDSTFFARVTGECMIGSGIFPDDLLVVDRSLTPGLGDIVVGIIENEFVLRSYYHKSGKEYLMADNQYFKPIERNDKTPFVIWGVVPHSIMDQRRRNNARINRFERLLR
jgi:DNA polymerase V